MRNVRVREEVVWDDIMVSFLPSKQRLKTLSFFRSLSDTEKKVYFAVIKINIKKIR